MNGEMKDLSNVISKLMAVGFSLPDVIVRANWKPAQVIHRPELEHLNVGAEADVAVFSLQAGDFGFLDVLRKRIRGDKKLETELTIREGKIVWDLNGLAAKPYKGQN